MILFYALHEALAMILEEGLAPRFARHQLNAAAFRAGITALGLQMIAKPEVALPTVTCVCLPDGISSKEFLHYFRLDHGLATLPGLGDIAPGPYASGIWERPPRPAISCMPCTLLTAC